jgi:cytidylate kinase
MSLKLITVAREFGAETDFIFERFSREYSFIYLDRNNLFSLLCKYFNKPYEELILYEKRIEEDNVDEKFKEKYKEAIKIVVEEFLKTNSVILMGRGGQFLFSNYPNSLHINIIAPLDLRIRNLKEKYNLDINTCIRLIKEKDEERERYFKNLFNKDWKDPYLYHLVINLSFYSPENIYHILVKSTELSVEPIKPYQENLPLLSAVKFANKNEEEFARLLTYYGISWEYESKTFPLEWDNEGQIIEAFTPDFYLPEFNLFIELTVQKPKLMSEKLRKIRKLKKLYPDINIKLLFGKKYLKILEKFGISKIR